MASELSPRSWICKIFVSGASRTSPTVLRSAAVSVLHFGRKLYAGDRQVIRKFGRWTDHDRFLSCPLMVVIRSACTTQLGCMLETGQRVDRAGIHLTAHEHACQRAPPPFRKIKTAMIVDATIIDIERRALEIFANRNTKR